MDPSIATTVADIKASLQQLQQILESPAKSKKPATCRPKNACPEARKIRRDAKAKEMRQTKQTCRLRCCSGHLLILSCVHCAQIVHSEPHCCCSRRMKRNRLSHLRKKTRKKTRKM